MTSGRNERRRKGGKGREEMEKDEFHHRRGMWRRETSIQRWKVKGTGVGRGINGEEKTEE